MSHSEEPLKILPLLTDIEYYILMAILIKPRHGIGIFEEVAHQTENQLVLSPGTLYAALKRMYTSRWIKMVAPAEAGYAEDERRKIYVATDQGIHIVREKVAWFEHELQRARIALADLPDKGPPNVGGSGSLPTDEKLAPPDQDPPIRSSGRLTELRQYRESLTTR
ncbi:MAG: hypothetical protein HC822_06120 [Oscillochloris sp.]|nr:hypothetical protein [Oscillochloris sp.]